MKPTTACFAEVAARRINYKARFYNPGLGRFMQTDPIGYEDDFNLYAYVYNDPLNKSDPTGETCVTYSSGSGTTLQNTCIADNATPNNSVPPTQRDPKAEAFGKSTIANLRSEKSEKTAVIRKNADGTYRQDVSKNKSKESAEGWKTKVLAGKGVVSQHSHPEKGSSIAPGYISKKDNDASVLKVGGISQIYNNERTGTLTVGDQGVVTYDVIGKMSATELGETQKALDKLQAVMEEHF